MRVGKAITPTRSIQTTPRHPLRVASPNAPWGRRVGPNRNSGPSPWPANPPKPPIVRSVLPNISDVATEPHTRGNTLKAVISSTFWFIVTPDDSRGAAMTDSMKHASEFGVRRIYEQPDPDEGRRVLVDRLWPRGIAKNDDAFDEWIKDVAPSSRPSPGALRGVRQTLSLRTPGRCPSRGPGTVADVAQRRRGDATHRQPKRRRQPCTRSRPGTQGVRTI